MTDTIDPIAVARSVTGTLDSLGVVNTIGGSIASSFAGEPRSTIDIDVVAAIEDRHVPSLLEARGSTSRISDSTRPFSASPTCWTVCWTTPQPRLCAPKAESL